MIPSIRHLRAAGACALTTIVLAALPGCFFVGEHEESRIGGDVDTSVKATVGPPTAGIFANGGEYGVEITAWGDGECEEKEPLDPADFIVNPLEPRPEGERTSLTPESQARLASFLAGIRLRAEPLGGNLVVGEGADSSQSLPWTGFITGGATQRFQAQSLVAVPTDRSVEFVVGVEDAAAIAAGEAVGAAAPSSVSVTWKESATLPPWIFEVSTGTANCVAEGTARLVKVAPPSVQPPPPSGAASVRSVDPKPAPDATELAAAVNLIGASSWITDIEQGTVSLATADGLATATGTLLERGNGWVVQLSGARDDVRFTFKGAKTEDGVVRGTLQSGGAETLLEVGG